MSRLETPMTRRHWQRVGGTLIEEFVRRDRGVAQRKVDAVIIVGEEDRVAALGEQIEIQGLDVIVVQTKAHRLGMYLMGQAFFSRVLIENRFAPRSVQTVALCARDDAALRPIAEQFGIEVNVDKPIKH